MRVGFDIGGTFTDVIVIDRARRIRTAKVLSLLDRVGEDIVACVRSLPDAEPVEHFVHATTTASNALIERRTAPTGLLTTRGFRDVLELMNQKAPPAAAADWERLPPLVPRWLRREVTERVLADGNIDQPLDRASAARAIDALVEARVEAIAVCLINSYINPAHERLLGAMVRERAPHIPVCLSADVHPECREYERSSTTVINASLVPVVNRYLDKLERHLAPLGPRLLIMQSNGGTMTGDFARQRPMHMVESGPAAGVLAAARLAADLNLPDVLSFDMGGTTAKACLIRNGCPLEKAGGEIGAGVSATRTVGAGHALRAPTLDIVEVGAGGGSIAWVDPAGALRAGPVSAGADPGPACYGRGGTHPTVTDANVVLGYMNPERIAGGGLAIDPDAARRAIETAIAAPLHMPLLEAAAGIVEVANAAMMRALRAVSTERGHDIRDMTLIAFGGAGPLHAASLCEAVGIRRVTIPPFPGLFSALGLLLASTRLDYLRGIERPLRDMSGADVAALFEPLEAQARRDFIAQGLPVDDWILERTADLRVGYMRDEMSLPLPAAALTDLGVLEREFHAAHMREFGFAAEAELHLVNLRLRACSAGSPIGFADVCATAPGAAAPRGTRQACFGRRQAAVSTPVLSRADIDRGLTGPLIVEEPDTTIVVPPGWTIEPGPFGTLALLRA
ncbi:MAG: hydantoinase/oxoprolinase family protein [Gammaproteobacteria bacterium]